MRSIIYNIAKYGPFKPTDVSLQALEEEMDQPYFHEQIVYVLKKFLRKALYD